MADLEQRLRAALADRYRVERLVGQGGMATVYLARDLKHDRDVAVKVLSPDLAAAVGHDRFHREIEIAARLQHPHILPVYDSGAAGGLLYYVMPFVEGESLRDRLGRAGPLPAADAARVAAEVAGALDYAHRHGIVHRDIKPANILLSDGHAVVADFGIARAISVSGGAGLTRTGMAIGTPSSMSPEQALGGVELDGRADIYALGCVLYEMLVGAPPYEGTTPQAILAKARSGDVPRLAGAASGLQPVVDRATARAAVAGTPSRTARTMEAHLAMARGDTSRAVQDLERFALRGDSVGCLGDYGAVRAMAWAGLLAQLGRLEDAVAMYGQLDALSQRVTHPAQHVRSFAERGALYQRLGDTTRAIAMYERFIGAWEHADDALQPAVERARAAVA